MIFTAQGEGTAWQEGMGLGQKLPQGLAGLEQGTGQIGIAAQGRGGVFNVAPIRLGNKVG